jgi:hypothetical protein
MFVELMECDQGFLHQKTHIFKYLYIMQYCINTVYFFLCMLKINHVKELWMCFYSWGCKHACEQISWAKSDVVG